MYTCGDCAFYNDCWFYVLSSYEVCDRFKTREQSDFEEWFSSVEEEDDSLEIE